jgi:hypothetical protein
MMGMSRTRMWPGYRAECNQGVHSNACQQGYDMLPERRFKDLRQRSFDELETYFHQGAAPTLQEMTGDTDGQFLAWRPGSGWLMKVIVWFLFRKWLGKRFHPSKPDASSSDGINLFQGGTRRYAFLTYVCPGRTDGAPCLRLDYSIDGLMRGLVDDVRTIGEGLVLGQIHYRLFWQKEPTFYLYFALVRK